MQSSVAVMIAAAAALLAACQSAPEPYERREVVELARATVVEVDAPSRVLVLRGPTGEELGLLVDPSVQGLSRVEAGDVLSVSYYTAILVSIAEPGSAGADVEMSTERTGEGERPSASIGTTVRETVEILSVAEDGSAVSFRDASGRLQSIDVRRSEGQSFARKLRRGDLVDVRYTRGVAIGVDAIAPGR